MSEDLNIARCQEGDREAFRVLVDRHKDVLYGTALLMTGNRAIAEEAVQEAFLSAWRGIGGFRRGRPLKPWLTRILVNGVLSQKRKRSLTTIPIEDSDGTGAPSVSDQTDVIEHRAILRQALAKLAPTAAAGGGAQVLRGAYSARNIRSDGSEGRHGQVASAQGLEPPAGTLGGVRIGEG